MTTDYEHGFEPLEYDPYICSLCGRPADEHATGPQPAIRMPELPADEAPPQVTEGTYEDWAQDDSPVQETEHRYEEEPIVTNVDPENPLPGVAPEDRDAVAATIEARTTQLLADQPAPAVPGWVDPATLPYEYRHVACGEVAFLLTYMPVRGQAVMAAGAYDVTGAPAIAGRPINCAHCAAGLAQLHHRHVYPRRPIVDPLYEA